VEGKIKCSFEMNQEDFSNLTGILHDYIVKYRYEYQMDITFTDAQKDWFKRHAEYIQTEILDKLLSGVQQ
jgi:hypothetical protein